MSDVISVDAAREAYTQKAKSRLEGASVVQSEIPPKGGRGRGSVRSMSE